MTVDPPASRSTLVLTLQRRHIRAAPGDVADLALLRRNLPRLPTTADPRAVALITPYCGVTREAQHAGLLTACLWAARHRVSMPVESTWNLGQALRAVPAAAGDRAWRELCAAGTANLPRRLAVVMDMLAHWGVATDWHRLHRDLRSWHQGFHHLVLGRWSTGLFGPAPGRASPGGSSQHTASTSVVFPDAAPARALARREVPWPTSPSELSS